jgi:hypothetical protein
VEWDAEIDINLRSAREVGRRLVVLATLCRRAFLESASVEADLDEDPEAERFDLLTWLQEQGLGSELAPAEYRLLDTAVGALSSDEAHAATWNAEALVALGWATGLLESLPDSTGPADPNSILTSIPAPWDDVVTFIASIQLRTEEAVAYERERSEIWLWRAEVEEERRTLRGRALSSLEDDLRDVVRESVEAGLLPSDDGRDFTVAGRSFRSLDAEAIDVIATVVSVRLHALNWLCGFGTSWDGVPLDIE